MSTASLTLARPARRQLPAPVAFAGISLALAAFFVAAGAPTPLLVGYERAWGFAPWLLTVAFGVYALGLLAAVLVTGSLSDRIGRRPVLLGSLALEAVAMVVFLAAGDIQWLIVARVLQGIATGAATSSFTAAIVELAPEHRKRLGALIGGVTPAAGLGVGALFAGGVAELAPAAPEIVWGILLGAMAVGVGIAFFIRETVTPTGGALASLRPRVAVPARARTPYLAAVPSLIGAWMLAALFMGLMPTILASVFGIHDVLVSAVTAFVEPAAAGLAAWLLGGLAPRRALVLGGVAVIAGTALVVAGVVLAILPLLWIGGTFGGIGFGLVFSGTLRRLAPLAASHERAGLFAAIYVVSYLAFGVPAIVAGQLVAPFGLLAVAVGFGVVVLIASAIGLAAQARRIA